MKKVFIKLSPSIASKGTKNIEPQGYRLLYQNAAQQSVPEDHGDNAPDGWGLPSAHALGLGDTSTALRSLAPPARAGVVQCRCRDHRVIQETQRCGLDMAAVVE